MMFLGCCLVYLSLFGIGSLIYGGIAIGLAMLAVAMISGYALNRVWLKR
jgi:hypothetical protein